MAEKRLLVCDQCDKDGADRWVFGMVGKPMNEIDLCDNCVTTVTDLIGKGRRYNPSKRAPYRSFQKVKVKEHQ